MPREFWVTEEPYSFLSSMPPKPVREAFEYNRGKCIHVIEMSEYKKALESIVKLTIELESRDREMAILKRAANQFVETLKAEIEKDAKLHHNS